VVSVRTVAHIIVKLLCLLVLKVFGELLRAVMGRGTYNHLAWFIWMHCFEEWGQWGANFDASHVLLFECVLF